MALRFKYCISHKLWWTIDVISRETITLPISFAVQFLLVVPTNNIGVYTYVGIFENRIVIYLFSHQLFFYIYS